jgi:hypothetical protein
VFSPRPPSGTALKVLLASTQELLNSFHDRHIELETSTVTCARAEPVVNVIEKRILPVRMSFWCITVLLL